MVKLSDENGTPLQETTPEEISNSPSIYTSVSLLSSPSHNGSISTHTPQDQNYTKYGIARSISAILQVGILANNLRESVTDWNSLALWFAYLTHLNLLLTVFYEGAMLAEMCRSELPPVNELKEKHPVLGDTTLGMSFAVAVLYWLLDRTGNPYAALLPHGVGTAILLTEWWYHGQSFAPKIELSWRFTTSSLLATAYVFGEAGLSFAGVRDANGGDLYKALPWESNFGQAALYGVGGVFFVMGIPVTFCALRAVKNKICPPATPSNESATPLLASSSKSWCCLFSSCWPAEKSRPENAATVNSASNSKLRQ